MNLRSIVAVSAVALAAVACGPQEAPIPLATTEPARSICQAATQAVGTRIRVTGDFDGFGYDTKRITLKTSETCNQRGAGLVFATLWSFSEHEKFTNTRPGTQVTVEGTIEKVEEGRFVHLTDVVAAR